MGVRQGAVTAGECRGDWCLPVAALELGDAAGLLQPPSAQGPLSSRADRGTPRMKSEVEAAFCERILWPCYRGTGSREEKFLPECLFLSPALAAVSWLQAGEGSTALTCGTGIVLVGGTVLRTGNFA